VLSQVRRDRTGPGVRPGELHTTSAAQRAPKPGDDHDGPGDHWVTIDGHHVLVHESQGEKGSGKAEQTPHKQETPESLCARIPAEVKAKMAKAIEDSDAPTADDKTGGFHEEYGVAGLDASGNWVVSRDQSGDYRNPDTAHSVSPSGKSANHDTAHSIIDPRVFFHVHPSGKTEKHEWVQPPSKVDEAAAIPGKIYLVLAAREKQVYFYDNQGIIGKPMRLKDFLRH
jgi:hypothetical protein